MRTPNCPNNVKAVAALCLIGQVVGLAFAIGYGALYTSNTSGALRLDTLSTSDWATATSLLSLTMITVGLMLGAV